MSNDQPWKAKGIKKDEWLADEVANAVGAGKLWKCETVDFSDPNRPPTCIEVDFPIIPINEPAGIEASSGAATKPIYQMTRWWARRQASVFRSMLLASAIKAPDDPAEAAKLVWDAYYGNYQKRGAFKDLKVADIFMGGGTTIIEGLTPRHADDRQRPESGGLVRGEERAGTGWVYEEKKVFYLNSPLDLARSWTGKHRRGMQSDYDQAMFLIGACFEGSGINASETLNNEHFRPHPALGAILNWFKSHGADSAVRNAAITASTLYHTWESRNQAKVRQLSLFDTLGEE